MTVSCYVEGAIHLHPSDVPLPTSAVLPATSLPIPSPSSLGACHRGLVECLEKVEVMQLAHTQHTSQSEVRPVRFHSLEGTHNTIAVEEMTHLANWVSF